MRHEHFKEIQSTQDYLIESNPSESTLVSCDQQINGHGQYGRTWDSDQESLCFSFTLVANEVMTLTSLEMGYLLVNYFKENYETSLMLKWPNDVLSNDGKKVAGILINNQNSNELIIGVGLNYFSNNAQRNYKTPKGHIFTKTFPLFHKEESLKIYNYIKNNRLYPNDIIQNWNEKCIHLNKEVTLIETEKSTKGIFRGIGKNGEALIETSSKVLSFYSGSLII